MTNNTIFHDPIEMISVIIKFTETNKDKKAFDVFSADINGSRYVSFAGSYLYDDVMDNDNKIIMEWDILYYDLNDVTLSLLQTSKLRREFAKAIKRNELPQSILDLVKVSEVHKL